MSCPDVDVVQALTEGRLDPDERARVVAHAEECASCRATLVELVRAAVPALADTAPGEPDGPRSWPQTGSTLGRFVVVRELGAGAMGVVVSAYDPDLDRRVAIKLLHADLFGDGASTESRARLLREARAMAKVSHPNIIAVHEVGTVGNQVFVVMEQGEGGTMASWLRAKRRSWREVRDMFARAGRGLAAAHAAGLVHRDFKPENVLVEADGRVRVTDFGLVGVSASPVETAEPRALTLTRTGAVLGTPRYMAPEQHEGRAVDARADQFAFCVALYEALCGRPPFAGQTMEALAEEVRAGRVRPPSGDAPAWLRRVVLQGLAVDPAARYPTMEALLADLERDRAVARRRVVRMAVMTLVAVAVVMAVAVGYRPHFGRDNSPSSDKITLAVLPFDLLTAEEGVDFLRVGIADAIITKLAHVGRLRLRPTSAVLSFEKHADSRQAGQALATDYVATGTVQKTGEQFRISVQLVRVADGATIWGEHYDLARLDLLSLENAIAEKIADALKVEISSAERQRLYRSYSDNPAAYEMYLKGRAELARFTPESTLAAIAAFESALRPDSHYALAHAGLAMASAVMRIRFSPEADVKGWEDRARQEAQRALELDADLAEAHEAIAAVYRYAEFDWDRVIAESRRALELNPSLEMPHYYLAASFYHLGMMEPVEAEVRAGLEINPANRAEALRVRGTSALFNARFQEAERFLTELRQMSGGAVADWYLAQTLYYEGHAAQAIAMLTALRGGAQVQRRAQATLAALLAAQHDDQRAREVLQDVTAGTQMTDHHVAYSIGAAYAQLREFDDARRWLGQAAATGFPCYPWFEQDPLLKPLRDDAGSRLFLNELRQSWESVKARYDR